MKKILFIANVDWFFVSHRLPIALKLLELDYEVYLVCEFKNHLEYLQELGIKCLPNKIKRSNTNPINLIFELINLIVILHRLKPNLIHLITLKPIILGGLISHLVDRNKLVMSFCGLGYIFKTKKIHLIFLRKLVSFILKIALSHDNLSVIFQNENDKLKITEITKLSSKKTFLIHGSGVDLNIFNPINKIVNKNIKVLFASRLLKSKGIYDFLDAATFVKGAEFYVAGWLDKYSKDCVDEDIFYQKVSKNNINYLGNCSDMVGILKKTSIVVLPSYYGEGLPKILIEASAFGIPIITTNQPGCSAAVVENITGFIVPVKEPKILADKIQYLIDNPKKMIEMGKEARSFALERFDIKLVVNKHIQIYKELLEPLN